MWPSAWNSAKLVYFILVELSHLYTLNTHGNGWRGSQLFWKFFFFYFLRRCFLSTWVRCLWNAFNSSRYRYVSIFYGRRWAYKIACLVYSVKCERSTFRFNVTAWAEEAANEKQVFEIPRKMKTKNKHKSLLLFRQASKQINKNGIFFHSPLTLRANREIEWTSKFEICRQGQHHRRR